VKPSFRPGTWRQAVLTYSAVLPVSVVLNFLLAGLTGHWPRLAVVTFNAAVLVAALNWVLLPALQRITRGWAAPPRHVDTTPTPHQTDGESGAQA
jgi:antibiotic biosynthesis monooxygenase (ABM) superfamily enzyme